MWTVVLMLIGLMLPAAALVLNAPGAGSLAVINRRRTPAVPCSMQCEKPCCKNSALSDTNAALDAAFLVPDQNDCDASNEEAMVDNGFSDMEGNEDGEEKKREGCCACCPPGCPCCAGGCRCGGLRILN